MESGADELLAASTSMRDLMVTPRPAGPHVRDLIVVRAPGTGGVRAAGCNRLLVVCARSRRIEPFASSATRLSVPHPDPGGINDEVDPAHERRPALRPRAKGPSISGLSAVPHHRPVRWLQRKPQVPDQGVLFGPGVPDGDNYLCSCLRMRAVDPQ
jgi:hypothetical protein